MSTDLVPLERANGLAEFAAPTGVESVRETMAALTAIRTFIKHELVKNIDFGVIPDTGQKPTLYKPGAEKAVMFFNAAPRYIIKQTELGNGHVEFVITARLVHRGTGRRIGEGLGSCSTMEKKYRWRGGTRVCPHCGSSTIFKSKEDRGGWFCWAKKGGCGAQFRENDQGITSQSAERSENPDIYDVRNTVLKMAKKRALVDAALSLGCLSELFTQDIEDTLDLGSDAAERPAPPPEPDQRKKANRPRNDSGHASGQYASPEQVRSYLDKLKSLIQECNAQWIDYWSDERGEVNRVIADGPILWREPLNVFQADNHLLKWCLAQNPPLLDPKIVPENTKSRQLGAYVAIAFHRSADIRKALGQEMNAYTRAERGRIARVIYERHPELRPADDGDQPTAPDPEDDGPVAGEDD